MFDNVKYFISNSILIFCGNIFMSNNCNFYCFYILLLKIFYLKIKNIFIIFLDKIKEEAQPPQIYLDNSSSMAFTSSLNFSSSRLVKRPRLGESRSKTPITSSLTRIGKTNSELDAESQATCPGKS